MMEFATKVIEFERCIIKAQIWDTAGQERHANMTSQYFRGAVGAVLVYDISNSSSFNNLKDKWLIQMREYAQSGIRCILVGNKCDLSEKFREVQVDEGIALAQKEGFDFIETSAKSGENVEVAFRRLILSVAAMLPDVKVHLELSRLPKGWLELDEVVVREVEPTNIDSSNDDSNATSRDSDDVTNEGGLCLTQKKNQTEIFYLNYWTGEKIPMAMPPDVPPSLNLIYVAADSSGKSNVPVTQRMSLKSEIAPPLVLLNSSDSNDYHISDDKMPPVPVSMSKSSSRCGQMCCVS